MATDLDLDDVAATSPLAKDQLGGLRLELTYWRNRVTTAPRGESLGMQVELGEMSLLAFRIPHDLRLGAGTYALVRLNEDEH